MTYAQGKLPPELLSFCERCSEGLKDLTENMASVEFVRGEMSKLLCHKELFIELMQNIVGGKEYPDARRPTMFDNEILLFVETNRLFSLRMYLWGPGEYTAPHDHNSWGVLGTVLGGFEVINYRREDDGKREGYAVLKEYERKILSACQTAYTLPFDEGIHETGNPTRDTHITLNLYGRSLPRGYLQGFDVGKNLVYRILPPRRKKEFLAGQALKSLHDGI